MKAPALPIDSYANPSPIRFSRKLRRVLSSANLLDGRRHSVTPFFNALLIFSFAILLFQAICYHTLFIPYLSQLQLTQSSPSPHARHEHAQQLASVLHDSFQIPHKLTRQLSLLNRDRLLTALRAHPSNTSTTISRGKRRIILFAHIHYHHDLRHRAATLASVLTFAKNTGRIPVVIWRHSRPYATFQDLFSLDEESPGQCPTLIVENLLGGQEGPYRYTEYDDGSNDTHNTDWAELSLLENIYNDHAAKPNPAMARRLDSAAVEDKHISLSLSKPLRSGYSSSTDSVHLLQRCLVGNIPGAKSAVVSAFLPALAEEKETMDINDSDAVFRKLHSRFKIPYALLDGMSPVTRRILLDKLLAKEVQGNVAPRVAFIQPQYGLGNRLRAMGSMWAYARATNRVLVAIWSQDEHMLAEFGDLFVGHDDIVISKSFSPNEIFPFRRNRRADKSMLDVKWYNYMKTHSNVSYDSSVKLEVPPNQHVYASSAYVVQSDKTPGIEQKSSKIWRILRELTPHINVARLVQRATAGSSGYRDMIGVHSRSRTIEKDVKGVDAKDYTLKSAEQTDFWRNATNVQVFLEEMRKQPDTQMFYVAADRAEAIATFEREFPGRITYTPRHCDSRGSECIHFALADVLLLAKCKTLLGSYWSSFSELSCRWGGAKYRLAGVDFGKPKDLPPNQQLKKKTEPEEKEMIGTHHKYDEKKTNDHKKKNISTGKKKIITEKKTESGNKKKIISVKKKSSNKKKNISHEKAITNNRKKKLTVKERRQ